MNLFGIGTGELLLILVIALLVVGPERLPGYARKGAILLRRLRSITDEVNRQIREELDLDDLTDIVQETRTTLSDPLGLKQLTQDVTKPPKPAKAGSGEAAAAKPAQKPTPVVENTIAPPGMAAQAEAERAAATAAHETAEPAAVALGEAGEEPAVSATGDDTAAGVEASDEQ